MRSGNATLVDSPPALIASANGAEDAWQRQAQGLAHHSASLKGSEKLGTSGTCAIGPGKQPQSSDAVCVCVREKGRERDSDRERDSRWSSEQINKDTCYRWL